MMTPRATFRPHERVRHPRDFRRAFDRRRSASDDARAEPELKALKDAGHEVGDFFFVPTRG